MGLVRTRPAVKRQWAKRGSWFGRAHADRRHRGAGRDHRVAPGGALLPVQNRIDFINGYVAQLGSPLNAAMVHRIERGETSPHRDRLAELL